MKKISTIRFPDSITCSNLADLALILYLASPLSQTFFSMILGPGAASQTISILLYFIPALIIAVNQPSKYFIADFWILLIVLLAFFGITLMLHPDYKFYYTRVDYGIWDHIFKPNRGLYAYLFLRLVNDPDRILKDFKISGWFMFAYFGHRIIQARQRGYWNGVVGDDEHAKLTYSVAFGYEVLVFATVFLYSALKYKSKADWIGAGLSTLMILVGGSRGPIIFIGLTGIIYILVELKDSKYKWRLLAAIAALLILMKLFFVRIITFCSAIMGRFGMSSRFFDKLLADDITNDSGRDKIWGAAISMIKEKPLGYGAYGARHRIFYYIAAGYPHNIVLEILIEFGVVFGGLLLLIMLFGAYKMIFGEHKAVYGTLFIPLFCASCALLVSLTFWGYRPFWMCLALGTICIRNKNKPKKLKGNDILKKGRLSA